MSPAAAVDNPAAKQEIERGPRRTLLWGGGLLVLGLALVGVGAADEGAVLALAGLFVTIYGIHRFGRLGPDEPGVAELDESPQRAAAVDAMWGGGLAVFAGLAVTLGSYFAATSTGGSGRYLLAYGAILGGGLRLLGAYGDLQKAKRAEAKRAARVAEAPENDDAPKPRRKRAQRRGPSDRD